MKTAEEFYKEYYPPKMHLFRDKHDRELQVFGINDMVDFAERFANAKAKALLEEAAEKIQLNMLNADSEWDEAFNQGNYSAKRIVSSLIPKDTTKD